MDEEGDISSRAQEESIEEETKVKEYAVGQKLKAALKATGYRLPLLCAMFFPTARVDTCEVVEKRVSPVTGALEYYVHFTECPD